mgnify:CR=1 FL=1
MQFPIPSDDKASPSTSGSSTVSVAANSSSGSKRSYTPQSHQKCFYLCPHCISTLGSVLIQQSIAVYWSDDDTFYYGVIDAYDANSNTHRILYEDNEWEFVQLKQEIVLYKYKDPIVG